MWSERAGNTVSSAVLSIGSNLGDSLGHLRRATQLFQPWLRAVSPVVRTPPWGPVEQDHFLNAVLLVDDPAADARQWLARARQAETQAGRERTVRWGPRTLDVDVISVAEDGQEVRSDDPELTLPHPRAAERAFVLVPWLAVDARAVLGGRPVAELLAGLAGLERDGIEFCPELTLR
jgi:2-amino-4-hydroxy-6-hydroxymethyldihydropteridine diphosphokinase